MNRLLLCLLMMLIFLFNGFSQIEKSFESYKEFDFIPNEKIAFYCDYKNDTLGNFPQRWISNSPGQVISSKDFPGTSWYRLNLGSTFATEQIVAFETNTTVEFDMIVNPGKDISNDKSEIQVYFHSQLPDENLGDYVPGHGGFCFKFEGDIVSTFNWKNHDFADVNYEVRLKELSLIKNKKVHISISMQGSRVRLYIDQFKIIDINNLLSEGMPPLDRISFFTNGLNTNFSFLISNIDVRTGAANLRQQLNKEGRFYTSCIKFIENTDTIQSLSYPVIKEIGQIINENSSDIKFKIVVHDNNELDKIILQRRATSIQKTLAEIFDVDEKRLSTEIYSPENNNLPNTTSEEKASNKKVEFVKVIDAK